MKIGSFFVAVGLSAVIAAGAGQYLFLQKAHEEVARLVARLVPYGDLKYEKLWAWPWGKGSAWGVSFRPEGILQFNLQTPLGERIEVEQVQLDEIEFNADGRLEQVSGSLIGARLPIADRRTEVQSNLEPLDIPPPSFFELGYEALKLDINFDLQYFPSAELGIGRFNIAGNDMGRAYLTIQLEGTPQHFERSQDQLRVRKSTLAYADDGLLARYKEVSASRGLISVSSWENELIRHIEQRAQQEKWKWTAGTASALKRAVRDSGYFRAEIDPPGDVVLKNIRLYPFSDWPPLLGFNFSVEGEFAYPPPLQQQRLAP